jgi:hypothetical protein
LILLSNISIGRDTEYGLDQPTRFLVEEPGISRASGCQNPGDTNNSEIIILFLSLKAKVSPNYIYRLHTLENLVKESI